MKRFKDLGLGEELIEAIAELGFEEPTEIQEKTIRLVTNERNVIGISATGSGKTLAFSAGIIKNTIKGKGVQALILTPTRELAEQITQVMKTFAKHTDLKVSSVYGGTSFDRQVEEIGTSEIVIATPGRTLDHLKKRTLNLKTLKVLVLDEADRMVDMGFLPDIEKIIRHCPEKRQNLLFSATTSRSVEKIVNKYIENPAWVSVKNHVDASKLKQYYYGVRDNEKFSLLVKLLREENSDSIMIFCNTRRNADLVSKNLKREGFNVKAIHGGLRQSSRTEIIKMLHDKKIKILICTDVAARGLDIKGISHVYNYDIPKTSEDYTHRIGRTARAGENGLAISIVTNRDHESLQNILRNRSLEIERKKTPIIEKVPFRAAPRHSRDSGSGRSPRRSSRGNFRHQSRTHRRSSSRRGRR